MAASDLSMTLGSQRLLTPGETSFWGQFSSTRRHAQCDTDAVGSRGVDVQNRPHFVSKLLSERKGGPSGGRRGLLLWCGLMKFVFPDLKGRWSQSICQCSIEKWSKCFL